jgi:DNA repair exonuclease SbcCD ATPase subunit
MTTGGPTTDSEPSFAMEQYRVAAPGLLEVEGAWDGVAGVDLSEPVLVLDVEDRVDHVDAESVRGTARKWHASFRWEGDPTAIRHAVLHVDGRLRVELGPHPSMRRRLGRTARPALALPAEPVAPDGPAAGRATADVDTMSRYAALLDAQDRLAVAQDEVEDAREEARRAWADAERARALRQREGERLHEALETLKRSAHEAVETERERRRALEGELEQLRGAAARVAEIEAERDEARTALSDARTELERATEDKLAAQRAQESLQALEAAVAEAERARAEAAAEAATFRDRLDAIRRALDELGEA